MFKISTRKTILAVIFSIAISAFVIREAWRREEQKNIIFLKKDEVEHVKSDQKMEALIKSIFEGSDLLTNIADEFKKIDLMLKLYHDNLTSYKSDKTLLKTIIAIEKRLFIYQKQLRTDLPRNYVWREDMFRNIKELSLLTIDNNFDIVKYITYHNKRKAHFQHLFNLMNISYDFQDSETDDHLQKRK